LYTLSGVVFPLETPWYELMQRPANKADTIDIYEEDRSIPMKMFMCNSLNVKSKVMNSPTINHDYINKLKRIKNQL